MFSLVEAFLLKLVVTWFTKTNGSSEYQCRKCLCSWSFYQYKFHLSGPRRHTNHTWTNILYFSTSIGDIYVYKCRCPIKFYWMPLMYPRYYNVIVVSSLPFYTLYCIIYTSVQNTCRMTQQLCIQPTRQWIQFIYRYTWILSMQYLNLHCNIRIQLNTYRWCKLYVFLNNTYSS